MITRRTLLAAAPAICLATAAASPAARPLTLFELRSYRTVRGQRDTLIDMFEAYFLDAYQAAGAHILATFRVDGDPDRWVWIRAFPDNDARAAALNGFYTSAIWRRLADPCNATIEDISDSLLLRPVGAMAEIPPAPAIGAPVPAALYELTRYFPRPDSAAALETPLRRAAEADAGGRDGAFVAALASAGLPNSYPRLPLREEPAIVTFTRFESEAARRAPPAAASGDAAARLSAPPETLTLRPTARSALR